MEILGPFSDFGGASPEEIFEADKALALKEGVKEPFSMPYFKRGSDRGVLLIHGFSSSPYELMPLTRELEKRGNSVYSVRIAGHGTSMEDLAGKTYADWYKSASYGYRALAGSCEKITVMGQSNGGLIALAAAALNKTDALGLLAPAFKIKIPGAALAGILKNFINSVPRPLREEDRPYNYKGFSIAGVYQMTLLQKYVRNLLPLIKMPVLLAFSRKDVMISPRAAAKSLEIMPSCDKTVYIYDNRAEGTAHILTKKHMTRIIRDVADWAGRV